MVRGLTYSCVLAPDKLIGRDGFWGEKGSSYFEPDVCFMDSSLIPVSILILDTDSVLILLLQYLFCTFVCVFWEILRGGVPEPEFPIL